MIIELAEATGARELLAIEHKHVIIEDLQNTQTDS